MRQHHQLGKIEGLIFDFDGTLIDSLGMWKDLDRIYLHSRGIELPPELGRAIEGLSFEETACYFKEKFSLEDPVESIVEEWHNHAEGIYPGLPFKEGAINFLDKMKNKGYLFALATSNSQQLVQRVLREKGLLSYFPVIVTADDVGMSKPHPHVFLEAARRLNLLPPSCLVFEDTYAGVLGAKRAGMTTVAVYDHHNEDNWQKTKDLSDYTLDHYDDFERILL